MIYFDDKRYLHVFIFLILCTSVAWYLTPSTLWYEYSGKPQYENIIPKRFAGWVDVSDEFDQSIVDPRTLDSISSLYNQTVTRWYLHQPTNRKLMLSVAYGVTQNFSKMLHRPELCYGSNGFEIIKPNKKMLKLRGRMIEISRFLAKSYNRDEHVSYFIRVGDSVIRGPALSLNYARYAMSAKGYIADGLLFRVSELNVKPIESYDLQEQFIKELIDATEIKELNHLIAYADNEEK